MTIIMWRTPKFIVSQINHSFQLFYDMSNPLEDFHIYLQVPQYFKFFMYKDNLAISPSQTSS